LKGSNLEASKDKKVPATSSYPIKAGCGGTYIIPDTQEA
jgi:hypothetical protein